MKKTLLVFALLGATAFSSMAVNPVFKSFLAPGVQSILITNNFGVTNLNYVAQNMLQGMYQIGTNSLGTGFNAPIATNVALTTYSNNVNFFTNSWYYPGQEVIVTNNASANTGQGAVILAIPGTNGGLPGLSGSQNLLQDVMFPINASGPGVMGDVAGVPGAATTTNSIGCVTIISYGDLRAGNPGGAGSGSNIVNVAFVGLPSVSPFPGAVSATGGISYPGGSFAPLETVDDVMSPQTPWTITYTNKISTLGAPTVITVPVPMWRFAECQGIRLRWAYSGTSTNGVWLQVYYTAGNP